MNKVAAFALRRKNSILSMSEKMFCPPQPLRFWITPACAGKSVPALSSGLRRWDHPRVCGEKYSYVAGYVTKKGSPPRVRGKVLFCYQPCIRLGITPACAGKSLSFRITFQVHRDHPRVCGEKINCWIAKACRKGSPPRMRGKAVAHRDDAGDDGITPACAGKRQ